MGEYKDEFREKGADESQSHLHMWNWRGAVHDARWFSGDDVTMRRKQSPSAFPNINFLLRVSVV